MVVLTSAGGIISLLDETEEELKVYALQQLDALVDQFWAEIADAVSKIEELYENEDFRQRELAALVASKVYYHLGDYEDSLQFALGAGKLLDLGAKSEYVETVISKCIDKYIALRTAPEAPPVDSHLESVVERMFQRCFEDGEYKQAIGIALESQRLDVVEESISRASKVDQDILSYVMESAMTLVESVEFRNKLLRSLVKLYNNLKEPDYFSVAQCLVHLNDPTACSEMLKSLLSSGEDSKLIAYQVAFDLEENATQQFLARVKAGLPAADTDAMETDDMPSDAAAFNQIRNILGGELSIKLNLEFLHRNNHADILILKSSKTALESRNSVFHTAVTFANAFMHAGTTSDEFLRQNLEWLSRATNWTKFSATAALGVIHKGQISLGKALLAPYLPKDGVSGSAYSEGGALFALGLIHANHGDAVIEHLTTALKTHQNEVIQHGACLGLGVAAMATDNDDLYETIKNVLFADSAVAGEAAGLAMGLVMLGTSSSKAIDEMLQYAHDTQHEKIIRGLAVGISMIMYGREETADALIEQLLSDKDPILRYGGIYTIAMAYAGTGNNKALKKLLHFAVSDVNDDVRRAAVTSIGFLLFKNHKQVPRIVQLLSESYNPHVRYGATLALGISCAGTGLEDALAILEPLTKDPVDYVRQGALISLAMVLVQHNEAMSPRVVATRKLYEKLISEKHEDAMSKFGAVLGQGIIDAGGRNVTISLQSRSGYANMSAIVGTAIFCQFWYWYPLTHFLSLAFTPTAIIALNGKLEIPKLEYVSNARSSLFAYHPPTKPPAVETVQKVTTAVLSTTAKAQARARRHEKEKGGKETPATGGPPNSATSLTVTDVMDVDVPLATPTTEAKQKKTKKKDESFEVLQNLTRVLPQQLKYITFKDEDRYQPVKKTITGGITIVKDLRRSEPEELISLSSSQRPATAAPSTTAAPASTPAAASTTNATPATDSEPAPPEAFEYRD